MKWSLCGKNDFPALVDFAIEKEWEHTFFTARLIEKDQFVLPSKNQFPIFILHENHRIKAACMVTSWGGLFPVFKSIDPLTEKEIKSLLIRLRTALRRIYSIMGTDERVEPIRKLLHKNKEVPVNYHLMVKKREPLINHRESLNDFDIHKADITSSAALLGLEMEYQKEEVFLDPQSIDKGRVYHNLKTSLARQIVYYATDGITPIAKGGTNAIGHQWNQLGGVYTDKKYRNRGISTWLLDFLINKIETDNKKTVLFVKDSNSSAERVYNKLGFDIVNSFKILYYV